MAIRRFILLGAVSLLVITLIVSSISSAVYSAQVETMNIPAGRIGTLNFNLDEGATFEGSLSVTGGTGDDINFWVTDPSGNQIISKRRVQSGGSFDFTANRAGAYTFNFDNSISLLSEKQVRLSYDIRNPIIPAGSGGSGGGGCLIATAAFGSELTPQVQFLRGFRDNHILATSSGASFMQAFNAWYYSFSPAVADFERNQPWLQQTVKVAIYPLLGILGLSEKMYFALPGEFGSISAGLIASSLIGAVYVSPIALSIKRIRRFTLSYRLAAIIISIAIISVVVSLSIGNEMFLMLSTSLLVILTLSITAMLIANKISRTIEKRKNKINQGGE